MAVISKIRYVPNMVETSTTIFHNLLKKVAWGFWWVETLNLKSSTSSLIEKSSERFSEISIRWWWEWRSRVPPLDGLSVWLIGSVEIISISLAACNSWSRPVGPGAGMTGTLVRWWWWYLRGLPPFHVIWLLKIITTCSVVQFARGSDIWVVVRCCMFCTSAGLLVWIFFTLPRRPLIAVWGG